MAMPSATQPPGATSAQSIPPAMTLRSLLDARRAEGRRMALAEAVAVIVPVCLDLQERHQRGEKLYVHPAAIAPGADGLARVNPRLSLVPTNTFDKHCLAPELQRTLEPGDARSSVFSLGAILYEMVTGQHIGPAMKRPRDIEPSLPEALEILIGKSIIGDRAHRPADLGALASQLYHVAPQQSIHPPDISTARLDASADLDVDVKFSMLPPVEHTTPEASGVNALPRGAAVPRFDGSGADPYGGPVIDRRSPPSSRRNVDDPTARLAALKARLESDPRPRYVVSKDKMDHGPFSAVELLQQIASHAFTGEHGLRDEISGQSLPIAEWEEFAPFAVQTGLLREKRAEEKAVVRAADADKKRGVAKSIIAVSVVVALGGVLTVWFLKVRGTHNDNVVVAGDRLGNVEINGDIKGKKKGAGGPGGGGGGGGPGYSGGTSFDSVLNGNTETITMGQSQDQPDLTNAQLAAPLRHASFITGCGAPDDMKVTVRVAVKMGRAVGVTVSTNPPSPGVAACVDGFVRRVQWPVSPKTDFVTTSY
jgi:eukaryotic-like serine/threonine-protein kinase